MCVSPDKLKKKRFLYVMYHISMMLLLQSLLLHRKCSLWELVEQDAEPFGPNVSWNNLCRRSVKSSMKQFQTRPNCLSACLNLRKDFPANSCTAMQEPHGPTFSFVNSHDFIVKHRTFTAFHKNLSNFVGLWVIMTRRVSSSHGGRDKRENKIKVYPTGPENRRQIKRT